jgi:hypothetical protein
MIYGTNSRKKEFHGQCIVAFVDILGFSNEITSKWESSEENPIERLKLFTNNVNRNISKNIKDIRSEAERDTYYGCKIITFSDSVIITYAFNGEPNKRKFLVGLYYALYTASFVWKTALRYKFTIRGEIDIGEMHWDDKIFAGPAFISAHDLECKVSLSSRITLGRNLVCKLCKALSDEQNDKLHKHFYDYFCNLIQPFLFLDCDGILALSPNSLYKKESEREKIILEIEQMQKECVDLKNKLKYVPLINALKNKAATVTKSDLETIKVKIQNKYAIPTT